MRTLGALFVVLALLSGTEGQQCSKISIGEEGNGWYKGQFKTTASSSFTGLTLEFTFDHDVDQLEFSAGEVEMINSKRFKLESPGWVAQPGWLIEFSFTPHFSSGKPNLIRASINGAKVCGDNDHGAEPVAQPTSADDQQCPQISIIEEGSGYYHGSFNAKALAYYANLTLEFTFDKDLNLLSFTGETKKINNKRFKIVFPRQAAEPGSPIKMDFYTNFASEKPIVTQIIMNSFKICGVNDNGVRPVAGLTRPNYPPLVTTDDTIQSTTSRSIVRMTTTANPTGQQCSQVSIIGEDAGTYQGLFSVASRSVFKGLTLEFTFNKDVDWLDFSAGRVQKIDAKRFRLVSSGWEARPGWQIEFHFTPYFSSGKPIVTHVSMNGVEVCGESRK